MATFKSNLVVADSSLTVGVPNSTTGENSVFIDPASATITSDMTQGGTNTQLYFQPHLVDLSGNVSTATVSCVYDGVNPARAKLALRDDSFGGSGRSNEIKTDSIVFNEAGYDNIRITGNDNYTVGSSIHIQNDSGLNQIDIRSQDANQTAGVGCFTDMGNGSVTKNSVVVAYSLGYPDAPILRESVEIAIDGNPTPSDLNPLGASQYMLVRTMEDSGNPSSIVNATQVSDNELSMFALDASGNFKKYLDIHQQSDMSNEVLINTQDSLGNSVSIDKNSMTLKYDAVDAPSTAAFTPSVKVQTDLLSVDTNTSWKSYAVMSAENFGNTSDKATKASIEVSNLTADNITGALNYGVTTLDSTSIEIQSGDPNVGMLKTAFLSGVKGEAGLVMANDRKAEYVRLDPSGLYFGLHGSQISFGEYFGANTTITGDSNGDGNINIAANVVYFNDHHIDSGRVAIAAGTTSGTITFNTPFVAEPTVVVTQFVPTILPKDLVIVSVTGYTQALDLKYVSFDWISSDDVGSINYIAF